MLEIVVFVAVVAAVYALKAVSIVRSHDDLAEQMASFNWMSASPEDEAKASEWAAEEPRMPEPRTSGAQSAFRPVHA